MSRFAGGRRGAAVALAGAATLAAALSGVSAWAGAASFSCGSSNGVPTTVARTDDGRSVPMIRWTSNVFDAAGWTPQRRCQEVSQRFESFRQQGRLTYVTTGRINGLPVICSAASDGGACDGLLYTLKPGQDPTLALKRLFDVRYKARGPLNETSARLYLSMDELLAASGAGDSASEAAPAPAGGSFKPLW
ncbi:MAG: COP23 domain-containing protein [Synechococcaceae cyanobacterium]|nr:COP23 domain-containing protein [Synechococcaceae cyanobacterium]